MVKWLKAVPVVEKVYMWLVTFVSSFLAYYTDLHFALYFFAGMTTIDTLSAIDVQARAKGLLFRPWKKYFWLEIKSSGLREWCEKVFWKYGRYTLIAFMLNEWVLKNMVIFDAFDRKLTLPVVAVYLFGFIEMWSIGENIEKAGGVNIFKRVLQFLPDKVQQIFQPNTATSESKTDSESHSLDEYDEFKPKQ